MLEGNIKNRIKQVKADGSLEHIGDKGAAYKIWKKAQDAPLESPLAGFTDEDILAEAKKKRLDINQPPQFAGAKHKERRD